MATLEKKDYGTRTALNKAANLVSLAAGEAKVIGVIDNTTDRAPGRIVDITISPGASAGNFAVYCAVSNDGTNYADGIDPTSDANQASKLLNAHPIQKIWNASSTDARAVFALPYDVHPEKCALVVKNNTAASTGGSGSSAGSKPVYPTVETV